MQVVIDIPEEAYNLLKGDGVDWLGAEHILSCVEKGKVLPKGHGDLIYRDDLWNRMSRYSDDEGAGVDYLNDDVNPIILRNSAMEVIENAQTIIPADKE